MTAAVSGKYENESRSGRMKYRAETNQRHVARQNKCAYISEQLSTEGNANTHTLMLA